MKHVTSSLKVFKKDNCCFRLRFDSGYLHSCHGCIYCYRKGLMIWQIKKDANDLNKDEYTYARPEELRKAMDNALNKKRKGVVNSLLRKRIPLRLGSMIDTFVEYDDDLNNISKEVIEILNEFKYPYLLFTKSDLIVRDDIIKLLIESRDNVTVHLCLAYNSDKLRKQLEPRAPSVDARKAAIEKLIKNGVDVVLRIAPINFAMNLEEISSLIFWYDSIDGKKILFEEIRLSAKDKKLFKEKFGKYSTKWLDTWKSSYWKYEKDIVKQFFKGLCDQARALDMTPSICGNFDLHKELCNKSKNCCQFTDPKYMM